MIFESFSVILRQISLGVHSHAVAYFPCLTKKSFKNRAFGTFRLYCDKYHSEYIRTPPFIFLVLRKNPPKIEILGLFGDTASNFARSTDSTLLFIFLVLRKNPAKIEILGLFGNTASNFARSTDSTPSLIFLVLRKNSSKIEILGLFVDTASNITRSAFVRRRLFSDRATKCVTRFTFNTNFNLCHSSG